MRLLKIMLLLLLVAAGGAVLLYEAGKDAAETFDWMLFITCFLSQLLFTVGVILLFAILISLGHSALSRLGGKSAHTVYMVTGFVGTPIHELSHVLMCLIFRHRIREMRLYQPRAEDGVLGYVRHTYRKTSLYQQIGNFFIGTAPILFGSAIIMLLMWCLAPDVFGDITRDMRSAGTALMNNPGGTAAATYFKLFGRFFARVFAASNWDSFLWWLFFLLAVMISMHMKLSRADVKGGFVGFLFLSGALLLADMIVCAVSASALRTMTAAMIFGSASALGFLLVALIFSCISVGLALLFSALIRILKGRDA